MARRAWRRRPSFKKCGGLKRGGGRTGRTEHPSPSPPFLEDMYEIEIELDHGWSRVTTIYHPQGIMIWVRRSKLQNTNLRHQIQGFVPSVRRKCSDFIDIDVHFFMLALNCQLTIQLKE
ncbi:hypothetical protein Nepgr_001241 [Nepenthes gracilis]|uniref:Uncharacterized protein n=1 Tax=Nepenthes gracilis TaxID=150966 RepID=A0AAD3RVX9_NEPGR|nr:hypothetical protein Nepgr_001241 [Nepenthes gracilis]